MINIDNKETKECDVYTNNYQISKMINKIVGKNTPWFLFVVGIIIFVFGKYDLLAIIGTFLLCVSFFVGGKQFGHDLGFKDGWYKLENRK